jgi:hypothetical protein
LASFDVFFEVEAGPTGATLRNDQPLRQQAEISEIPPRNLALTNANTVLITDILDPTHVDRIRRAFHWMCPPPFPPNGPCPVPCSASPFPTCQFGACPTDERCVEVAGAAACECLPVGFPPGGTDLSPSSGIFQVRLVTGEVVQARVDGDVLLRFDDAQTDPVSGQRTVQTEILSMDLSGADPTIGSLRVQAGSQSGIPGLTPSLGTVVPLTPSGDFPALASFDVFFEVEAGGAATLRNDEPLLQQAEINEIPPRNLALTNANTVTITDLVDPAHVDVIQQAFHWMCPPPFPPSGPCPVPCDQNPFPICRFGDCPSVPGGPPEICIPDPLTGTCFCGPPPCGPVIDLRFTSNDRLEWNPLPCAAFYNLYRQTSAGLVDADSDGLADDYGACFRSGLPLPEAFDASSPPLGLFHHYLPTGNDPGTGEGPLGNTSLLNPRPNRTPCP